LNLPCIHKEYNINASGFPSFAALHDEKYARIRENSASIVGKLFAENHGMCRFLDNREGDVHK
jgi:hypothetical protein